MAERAGRVGPRGGRAIRAAASPQAPPRGPGRAPGPVTTRGARGAGTPHGRLRRAQGRRRRRSSSSLPHLQPPQNAAARDRSRSSSCRGPAPQKGSSGGTVAPTGVTPRPLGWPAGCRARSRLSSVRRLLTGRPLGCSRPASPPGASRGSLLPATGLPAAAREGLTRPRLLPDRAGAPGPGRSPRWGRRAWRLPVSSLRHAATRHAGNRPPLSEARGSRGQCHVTEGDLGPGRVSDFFAAQNEQEPAHRVRTRVGGRLGRGVERPPPTPLLTAWPGVTRSPGSLVRPSPWDGTWARGTRNASQGSGSRSMYKDPERRKSTARWARRRPFSFM